MTVTRKGARKQNAKKNAARSRVGATRGSGEVLELAKLIADPCTANLVAPQYGASDGGYLAKFSSYHSHQVGSTGNSGFCIWYPDYTGRANSPGGNGSLYMFASTSGAGAPVNTTAAPLGRSGTVTDVQGAFLNDPGWDFLNSDIVQDTRTVAACMKMMYTGRNDSLSGRIAYLESVPRAALLVGDGSNPPSINDLFRYSNTSCRTPLDMVENKSRPGEGSDVYRVPHHEAHDDGVDYAFVQGDNGVSKTSIGYGTPTGVGCGIGFIWDGLANDSSLSFDFLKAVEWRPEVNSGLVVPPHTQAQGGQNIVNKALSYLDKHHHGWERQAFAAAKTGAAFIAQQAFQGPNNPVLRLASGAAMLL